MKKILITLFFGLCTLGVSAKQADKTFKMYTIRQRQLCLTSETKYEPYGATGSYELDETELFKIFDVLKIHLHGNLDLSKISERYYPEGNILFNFNSYYLQFIPFTAGSKRMVYINAYLCSCDYPSHGDEAGAKDYFVSVFDGGSGYWQIIYDVDEGKFLELRINGCA